MPPFYIKESPNGVNIFCVIPKPSVLGNNVTVIQQKEKEITLCSPGYYALALGENAATFHISGSFTHCAKWA